MGKNMKSEVQTNPAGHFEAGHADDELGPDLLRRLARSQDHGRWAEESDDGM